MVIIYISVNSIYENPCFDKNQLIQKMDSIFPLIKYIFFGSMILSILTIIGTIIYLIYKSKQKKKNTGNAYVVRCQFVKYNKVKLRQLLFLEGIIKQTYRL
jgi:hypothetical protein